jgi:drug/metabolite transporter (DMT)-like permease
MSDPQHPPNVAPRSPRSPRNIGFAVVLILFGVILLLPGACSVVFFYGGMVTWLGFLGLIIALAGVWMIGKGISTLAK